MGNAQINTTYTSRNGSENDTTNYTSVRPTTEEWIPPFRLAQSREATTAQLESMACISALTFAINLFMVSFTSLKLKAVPYMFIQNFMVVDMVNALVTSGPWAVGILLDFFGLAILGFLCRIQGFFLNTLASVFLGNVSVIAISRFLYVVSPSAYSMFFVEKPLVRLLLFTIWFGAGFLASPPLNKGTWGAYDKLEAACWMSWKGGDTSALSYSAFHTVVTLGPAVLFTVMAIVVIVYKKKNAIKPTPPALSEQPITRAPHPPATPSMMGSVMRNTHFLNLEVLHISCAVFVLYLILWTSIAVVQSIIIVDWRKVDYRVVIALFFVYQSRGLLHPFIYLLLSREMRNAFTKCGKGRARISLSTDNGRLPSVATIPDNAPDK